MSHCRLVGALTACIVVAACADVPLPANDPTLNASAADVLAGHRYIGLCGIHPILTDFKKGPDKTLQVDFYTSAKDEFANKMVTDSKGLGSRKNFPVIVSKKGSDTQLDVAHSGGVYTFRYTAGDVTHLRGECGDNNNSKPWPMSVERRG